jgi:hypothetical protein
MPITTFGIIFLPLLLAVTVLTFLPVEHLQLPVFDGRDKAPIAG